MKIGIMGPSRSGKDEMAEWFLQYTKLRYAGTTSTVISREVARREGISYEEAHAKRHPNKIYWRALGDEMRAHDPAALARAVLENSDMLVGVRAAVEIDQVIKEQLVDIIFWIDRPGIPFDPTIEFNSEKCHLVIQNHWGLSEYYHRLAMIAKSLGVLAKDVKTIHMSYTQEFK